MSGYGLILPFFIDTEGYSDRDRAMFVAGAEFAMKMAEIEAGWRGAAPVHRENESRFRMACGRLGLRVSVRPLDGYDDWSELEVFA